MTRWISRTHAVVGVLTIVAAADARGEPKKPRGEIRFEVTVEKKGHDVFCSLYTRDDWLEDGRPAKARVRDGRGVCVFRGVKPGVYAVSAFHDEDGDGELDTGLFGIPREAWCMSRDARGSFGPPKFEDARFRFRGGVGRLACRAR